MIARLTLPVLAVVCLSPASALAASPTWQPAQPPPPGGAQFPASVGPPGDMQFYAPNRGLMITAGSGSAAFPKGLLYWNGQRWRQLATVCGGQVAQARIAWAGPTEFWTIADKSAGATSPVLITTGSTLCHFRNGAVVASYALPDSSADPYRRLESAACYGPDDCWFGGVGGQTPDGIRQGSFHLHWDGVSLTTQYVRHGRAVSDLEQHDSAIFESTYVGGQTSGNSDTVPHNAEPVPHLLHRIVGGQLLADPWLPAPSGAPADGGTELSALDSDGSELWAIGGAAGSGPNFDPGDPFERAPLAARLGDDDAFHELAFTGTPFSADERLVDVAAVPGTDTAWVAIQRVGDAPADAHASVALLHADGTVTDRQSLPAGGPPRGPAARIACPATDDCWMVTGLGWVFHYSDGSQGPIDTDPAFANVIETRPPDGLTPQTQPDSIPEDDSLRFQQAPDVADPPANPTESKTKRVRAAVRRVRTKLRGRHTLLVSFTLARTVRVAVVAKRKGRVIARTKLKRMRRGQHEVLLELDPKRPPTGLSFITREIGKSKDDAGAQDSPDTVSTGGAAAAVSEGDRAR